MSSSELTLFAFDEHMVRVRTDAEGNPWFVARDVCRVLDLSNVTEALRNLDEDEKAEFRISEVRSDGIEQVRTYLSISESGLYALIFRSRKPEAKAFSKWVRAEVLPALRRHGCYAFSGATPFDLTTYLDDLPDEARHLRPSVRSKVLWCAMKAAEMDNSGTEGVVRNFAVFCRLVGEAPHSAEGQLPLFMNECLAQEAGARSPALHIYNALRLWWRQRGKGPLPSEKRLAEALDSRFSKKNPVVLPTWTVVSVKNGVGERMHASGRLFEPCGLI